MGQVLMLQTAPVAEPYTEAVANCVAERLRTLGRAADMVTPGALDALMEHADGSIPRLRAALASAMFLAATEDAPRIERQHVERAIDDTTSVTERVTPAETPSRPARTFIRPVSILAALLICATAAFAMILASRGSGGHGPPPTPASQTEAVASAPTPSQPTAAPPSPQIAPAPPAMAPAAMAPPATAPASPTASLPPVAQPTPMPPPIVVTDPPLPPNAQPQPPALAPAAPVTTIVLRYRQGDPWAIDKLTAASESLRQAGYSRIYAYPWHGPRPAAPIGYFTASDQAAAESVAAIFNRARLVAGVQRHGRDNDLTARRHAGRPHPPGTIEALLP